ncbi:MAG: hypothetical protein A4E58_01607 [Syntrophorhabdus sp. PtaB.Bin006]|nr:MAG: hypothetical protein A4E58_01607 [Syntrophorhabdus sp. PtaB.Bin006]
MIIAEIEKNRQEKIIIEVGEFHGHQTVTCRVWWETPAGTWVPVKTKGIAFTQKTILHVIEGLEAAAKELKA